MMIEIIIKIFLSNRKEWYPHDYNSAEEKKSKKIKKFLFDAGMGSCTATLIFPRGGEKKTGVKTG